MMRQLGGSFGIAIMTTIIHIRTAVNRNVLLENINDYNPAFNERLNGSIANFMSRGFSLEQARAMAMGAIEGTVSKQVMLTVYNGMYLLIGTFTLLCIPLIFLQPFSKKPVAMPVDAH
jgi:DHA2 family multidrug resistance protein